MSRQITNTQSAAQAVKTGQKQVIKIAKGQHLRVQDLVEGKLKDAVNVVVVKTGKDLGIRFADGTELRFEGFYDECAGNACSVTVAGKEAGGYIINGDTALGAVAADGSQLVYAYGEQASLMSMAVADPGIGSALGKLGEGVVSYIPAATSDAGWGALTGIAAGGAGIAAGAGGGGASAIAAIAPIVVPPAPLPAILVGSFVAGPVVSGHGLVATAYDANGQVLGTATLNDDGSFELNLGLYTGPVLVVVRDDTDGADYWDEATGAEKDLSVDMLRAVTYATEGGTIQVNVNVFTEVAVQLLLDAEGKMPEGVSAGAIAAANKQVADALGLQQDIVSGQAPIAVVTDTGAANQAANTYGKLLAGASGVDEAGSTESTIAALLEAVQDAVNPVLTTSALLLQGAANVVDKIPGFLTQAQMSLNDYFFIADTVNKLRVELAGGLEVGDYATIKELSDALNVLDRALDSLDEENAGLIAALQTAVGTPRVAGVDGNPDIPATGLYLLIENISLIKGDQGDPGEDGADGANGKSAFELWQALTGNEEKDVNDFFAFLKGADGVDGAAGADGEDGKSAFELWQALAGNEEKDVNDFFAFLKGADGVDGAAGADGEDGKSAFELWQALAGNEEKDVSDFFAFLKGADGVDGAAGADGEDGKSAFELWQALAGNEEKDINDFFAFLKGDYSALAAWMDANTITATAAEIFGGSSTVENSFSGTFNNVFFEGSKTLGQLIDGFDPTTVQLTVTTPLTVAQAVALAQAGLAVNTENLVYEIRDAYTTIQSSLTNPQANAAMAGATLVLAYGNANPNDIDMMAFGPEINLRIESGAGADIIAVGAADDVIYAAMGTDTIWLTPDTDDTSSDTVIYQGIYEGRTMPVNTLTFSDDANHYREGSILKVQINGTAYSHTVTAGQTPEQALASFAAAIKASAAVSEVVVRDNLLEIFGATPTTRLTIVTDNGSPGAIVDIANPGQKTVWKVEFSDDAADYPDNASLLDTLLFTRKVSVTIESTRVEADVAYANGSPDPEATLLNLKTAIEAKMVAGQPLANVLGGVTIEENDDQNEVVLVLTGKSLPEEDSDAPTFSVTAATIDVAGKQQQTSVSFSSDDADYYDGGTLSVVVAGKTITADMVAGDMVESMQNLLDAIEVARAGDAFPSGPAKLTLTGTLNGVGFNTGSDVNQIDLGGLLWTGGPAKSITLTITDAGQEIFSKTISNQTFTLDVAGGETADGLRARFIDFLNQEFQGKAIASVEGSNLVLTSAADLIGSDITLSFSGNIRTISPVTVRYASDFFNQSPFTAIGTDTIIPPDAAVAAALEGAEQVGSTATLTFTAKSEAPDPLTVTDVTQTYAGEAQQATISLEAATSYAAYADGTATSRGAQVYYEGGKVYATITPLRADDPATADVDESAAVTVSADMGTGRDAGYWASSSAIGAIGGYTLASVASVAPGTFYLPLSYTESGVTTASKAAWAGGGKTLAQIASDIEALDFVAQAYYIERPAGGLVLIIEYVPVAGRTYNAAQLVVDVGGTTQANGSLDVRVDSGNDEKTAQNLVAAINAESSAGGKLDGVIGSATYNGVTGEIMVTAAEARKETFEISDVRLDYIGVKQLATVSLDSAGNYTSYSFADGGGNPVSIREGAGPDVYYQDGKVWLTITPAGADTKPVTVSADMVADSGSAGAESTAAALQAAIEARLGEGGDLHGVIGTVTRDGATLTLEAAVAGEQTFSTSGITLDYQGLAQIATANFSTDDADYYAGGKMYFDVTSAGEDGVMGTEDDVVTSIMESMVDGDAAASRAALEAAIRREIDGSVAGDEEAAVVTFTDVGYGEDTPWSVASGYFSTQQFAVSWQTNGMIESDSDSFSLSSYDYFTVNSLVTALSNYLGEAATVELVDNDIVITSTEMGADALLSVSVQVNGFALQSHSNAWLSDYGVGEDEVTESGTFGPAELTFAVPGPESTSFLLSVYVDDEAPYYVEFSSADVSDWVSYLNGVFEESDWTHVPVASLGEGGSVVVTYAGDPGAAPPLDMEPLMSFTLMGFDGEDSTYDFSENALGAEIPGNVTAEAVPASAAFELLGEDITADSQLWGSSGSVAFRVSGWLNQSEINTQLTLVAPTVSELVSALESALGDAEVDVSYADGYITIQTVNTGSDASIDLTVVAYDSSALPSFQGEDVGADASVAADGVLAGIVGSVSADENGVITLTSAGKVQHAFDISKAQIDDYHPYADAITQVTGVDLSAVDFDPRKTSAGVSAKVEMTIGGTTVTADVGADNATTLANLKAAIEAKMASGQPLENLLGSVDLTDGVFTLTAATAGVDPLNVGSVRHETEDPTSPSGQPHKVLIDFADGVFDDAEQTPEGTVITVVIDGVTVSVTIDAALLEGVVGGKRSESIVAAVKSAIATAADEAADSTIGTIEQGYLDRGVFKAVSEEGLLDGDNVLRITADLNGAYTLGRTGDGTLSITVEKPDAVPVLLSATVSVVQSGNIGFTWSSDDVVSTITAGAEAVDAYTDQADQTVANPGFGEDDNAGFYGDAPQIGALDGEDVFNGAGVGQSYTNPGNGAVHTSGSAQDAVDSGEDGNTTFYGDGALIGAIDGEDAFNGQGVQQTHTNPDSGYIAVAGSPAAGEDSAGNGDLYGSNAGYYDDDGLHTSWLNGGTSSGEAAEDGTFLYGNDVIDIDDAVNVGEAASTSADDVGYTRDKDGFAAFSWDGAVASLVTAGNGGLDVIHNFQPGEDFIRLEGMLAGTTTSGDIDGILGEITIVPAPRSDVFISTAPTINSQSNWTNVAYLFGDVDFSQPFTLGSNWSDALQVDVFSKETTQFQAWPYRILFPELKPGMSFNSIQQLEDYLNDPDEIVSISSLTGADTSSVPVGARITLSLAEEVPLAYQSAVSANTFSGNGIKLEVSADYVIRGYDNYGGIQGTDIYGAEFDLSFDEFGLVTSARSTLSGDDLEDAVDVAALLNSMFDFIAGDNNVLNTSVFAVTDNADQTRTAIWAHRQSSSADSTVESVDLYLLAMVNTTGEEFQLDNFRVDSVMPV